LSPVGLAALASGAAPLVRSARFIPDDTQRRASMAHQLPPLPYDYTALEPHMDEMTVRIHHDKHHATYVTNLNAALEKHPELFKKSLEDLLRDLNAVPEDIRTAVRNNGGQTYNHNMYWDCMAPKAGGAPTGPIADAINAAFGSFDAFKDQFSKTAVGRFGSGWGWLVKSGGKLAIESSSNEGCPLMEGKTPLLVVDVWEHAYYLDYQNRRPDHVNAVLDKLLNWDFAAANLK
jgi:Fe-Mn family superoxide dismutase